MTNQALQLTDLIGRDGNGNNNTWSIFTFSQKSTLFVGAAATTAAGSGTACAGNSNNNNIISSDAQALAQESWQCLNKLCSQDGILDHLSIRDVFELHIDQRTGVWNNSINIGSNVLGDGVLIFRGCWCASGNGGSSSTGLG